MVVWSQYGRIARSFTSSEHRSAALAGLGRIGRQYVPRTSELAFAYALRAAERGYPHQPLAGVRLAGARLSGWAIGTESHDNPPLPMAGADLNGADLRHARFHRVDLTGADLSRADLTVTELHNSRLTSARFDGARAIGTIIRECALDDVEIARATTYRTQILRCTPAPKSAPELLIAPLPDKGRQVVGRGLPLRPLSGHTGVVWAVAWSPDGTRLLTGGGSGAARVWDAATGLHVGLRIVTLPEGGSPSSTPSRTSSSVPARGPGAGSAGTSSRTANSPASPQSPSGSSHPCIPPPDRRSRPDAPATTGSHRVASASTLIHGGRYR
ncbi:MAG: WD40 repeat domain-containing protein [Pseudonocardiaceae bacterium]